MAFGSGSPASAMRIASRAVSRPMPVTVRRRARQPPAASSTAKQPVRAAARAAFALAASNEFGTVPPHCSRVSGSP